MNWGLGINTQSYINANLRLGGNTAPSAALSFSADKHISFSTVTGTKIGTTSSQKLAFYGTTPVSQPATVSDPTGGSTIDTECRTAVNTIIDRLQSVGLVA